MQLLSIFKSIMLWGVSLFIAMVCIGLMINWHFKSQVLTADAALFCYLTFFSFLIITAYFMLSHGIKKLIANQKKIMKKLDLASPQINTHKE